MPRSKRLLRRSDQQTGLKVQINSGKNHYPADDDYIIADLDIPVKETVKTNKELPTRPNTRQGGSKKAKDPLSNNLPLTAEVLIPKFEDSNPSSQVNTEDAKSYDEIYPPESGLSLPILTEAQIKKEIIETDSESASSDSSSSDNETGNSSESGSSASATDSDSDSDSSTTSSEENDQKPQLISFPAVKVTEGLSTDAPQIIEPLTVLPYKGEKRGPKRKKPIKIRDPNKPIRKSPGTPWNPIPCPHCPKLFRYISQLRQHSTAHSKERPFYCDECGKSFTRNCFLEEHRACHLGIRRKDKDFSCSYCEKKFLNSTELKLHTRTHTGEKPFGCDLCGRSFSVARTLKIHLRRHAGEKPFKCTDCDKAFTVKLELQRHLQRVHDHQTRENGSYKRVECKECGRNFSHVGILKDHLLIHQGIKPFQCPFCDITFRQSNHLDHHIRVHKWKS